MGKTKQLDIFLVNEQQLWIEITVEKKLGDQYKLLSVKTQITTGFEHIFFVFDKIATDKRTKLALYNVDWQKLNGTSTEKLCYNRFPS